jgi:hypothetical protein
MVSGMDLVKKLHKMVKFEERGYGRMVNLIVLRVGREARKKPKEQQQSNQYSYNNNYYY